MHKYRSTINPISLIVTLLLYFVLLYLVFIRTPGLFIIACVLVAIMIGLYIRKLVTHKYILGEEGLVIIHKRQRILLLYKDILKIEPNSSESGLLYGYGYNRILIASGRSIDSHYIITPAKDQEFLRILEDNIKNCKTRAQ